MKNHKQVAEHFGLPLNPLNFDRWGRLFNLDFWSQQVAKSTSFIVSSMFAFLCSLTSAQELKRLPPNGKAIDPAVRETLNIKVLNIQQQIDRLATTSPDADDWQPDVEVLVRAVRLALEQNLFFRQSETEIANDLLNEGQRRLEAVKQGDRQLRLLGFREEKRNKPQLLVGGFRSRIDNSVQPYGIVIPVNYEGPKKPYRTDIWLHGRGDTKTEIPFLHERMNRPGQYTPKNTIVLHPFGRHCNAFKFAGETDVYEALAHLGNIAALDKQRLSIRGFSMGGAGCWHLAVHDPGRWYAANPGAGFVDTIVYQGWTEKKPYVIDPTRKQLMKWYDVLPWANNLKNTRTIPYSGEKDKQKQAADRVMAKTNTLGIEIPYIIGKNMGHKIDAESAKIIDETLTKWARHPAKSPRTKIDFTTYTLRYNKIGWLTVTGLQSHWQPSRIKGQIMEDSSLSITTHGITGFEVDFRESAWPETDQRVKAQIDGQVFHLDDWSEEPGVQCEFTKKETWEIVEQIAPELRKRPGLQGPIDDAFCDKFLFVAPSRPAQHGTTQRWINKEFNYAKDRWSRLMRGDVNVVLDKELTEEQIKSNHLICFGDFYSNEYLRSIAAKLPIQWTKDTLAVGTRKFESSKCVPAFCFPNPRNPKRYVVINSGMTYREFSNVSNSRQIPMLPDWAILGIDSRDDAIFAGEVIAQGFFDENWSLPEQQPTPAR